jgi:hypothetical protein
MGGVLSSTFHNRWIGRGEPTAWPPLSLDFCPLDLYPRGGRHLKALVYWAPVHNVETLHQRIVNAFHTYLWVSERVPLTMIRRSQECIRGHPEHFLWMHLCSAVTRSVWWPKLTWTRFLVLIRGAHPQCLSAHFSFTLYIWIHDVYVTDHIILLLITYALDKLSLMMPINGLVRNPEVHHHHHTVALTWRPFFVFRRSGVWFRAFMNVVPYCSWFPLLKHGKCWKKYITIVYFPIHYWKSSSVLRYKR